MNVWAGGKRRRVFIQCHSHLQIRPPPSVAAHSTPCQRPGRRSAREGPRPRTYRRDTAGHGRTREGRDLVFVEVLRTLGMMAVVVFLGTSVADKRAVLGGFCTRERERESYELLKWVLNHLGPMVVDRKGPVCKGSWSFSHVVLHVTKSGMYPTFACLITEFQPPVTCSSHLLVHVGDPKSKVAFQLK